MRMEIINWFYRVLFKGVLAKNDKVTKRTGFAFVTYVGLLLQFLYDSNENSKSFSDALKKSVKINKYI